MNERIRKMMTDVGIDTNYLTNTKQIVLLDAFAQLIVHECIDVMENCDGDLDFAIHKTKEQFGVDV